jgi:hypothetical protein
MTTNRIDSGDLLKLFTAELMHKQLRKILESKTPKNLVKDLALDYMSANELE